MTGASNVDMAAVRHAYEEARGALLGLRSPEGCWRGRLSSSALATATAVSALSLLPGEAHQERIRKGAAWLAARRNPDGGWGDTTDSPSNLSTTMLARAALRLSGAEARHTGAARAAEDYLDRTAGPTPAQRARSVRRSYGADRTFAAPILVNCALAGLVGWDEAPRLPFELACLPAGLYRRLRLHVVSYALPALIAVGQLIHERRPSRNALARSVRDAAVRPTLRKLERLQPPSGGFLEAVPLTSFVVMSLAACGRGDSPVARLGEEFLVRWAREDGSWPIEANLATWLTSASALALGPDGWDAAATLRWLVERQRREVHPYTQSEPGGWAWTDLPGGVPDADDTAGALLALAMFPEQAPGAAVRAGLRWLVRLQNADSGWPTFCRGWGRLPFDRSAPDLTAHAVRAIAAWPGSLSLKKGRRAVERGFAYLRKTQAEDGSWRPLWFGDQAAPGRRNPVYGTCRALAAFADLGLLQLDCATRGVRFLQAAQNADGGWGGAPGVSSAVEQTALALDALLQWQYNGSVKETCSRGVKLLVRSVAQGGLDRPAPIGLYFERLWYSERLYPIVWTVRALRRFLEFRRG